MTANHETMQLAAALHNSVSALQTALFGGVLQRMDEAARGLRASRFDAVTSRGGHSDATAGVALAETDLAVTHRAEVDERLWAARGTLGVLEHLFALYPPPRVADAADRAALERLNGREPCCQNCARTRRSDGEPRWVPVDTRLTEATTVGGRLPEALLLCVWCVEKVRAWGRAPNIDELERHHAGQRVDWPPDVARPS
jgi:hypothetical protein